MEQYLQISAKGAIRLISRCNSLPQVRETAVWAMKQTTERAETPEDRILTLVAFQFLLAFLHWFPDTEAMLASLERIQCPDTNDTTAQ